MKKRQSFKVPSLGFDRGANAVYVGEGWSAKEGQEIIPHLALGKILGAGMQGQIFELTDGKGHTAPIVLKVAKSAALIGDMEREWDAGQKITQLADQQGNLPGFMKVGPALRSTDGKMIGQVLERLNGKSVSKIFAEKGWADIHYIRSLMLEVFAALDKAERRFGFHHCDFRLENVMEHFPSRDHSADDEISIAVSGRVSERLYARQFKMIDYGLAKFDNLYCAAHGWLELEAVEGEESESAEALTTTKLAFPEWVHHTAWRGKGDAYHLVFDITQCIYGRIWPEEDKSEVELLLMLISHICGVRPKAWFRPNPNSAQGGSMTATSESIVGNTKYAIPETASTPAGKVLQFYGKYSRIQRWGRKLKAWRSPHNPGVTGAEILTAAFFYVPPGRGVERPAGNASGDSHLTR